MEPSSLTSSSRRTTNGRLRACDPCKRQKLACNHAQPCKRCKRLGQDRRCIYSGPASASPNTAFRRPRKPSKSSSDRSAAPSTSSPSLLATLNTQSSVRSPDSSANVGYLGNTSYKAVFEETRNTLSNLSSSSTTTVQPLSDPAATAASAQEDTSGPNAVEAAGTTTRDILRLPPAQLQALCVRVLHQVPTPATAFQLFRAERESYDGWIYHSAKLFLQGLYGSGIWSSYLTPEPDDRPEEQLVEMAGRICLNSMRDVVEDMADAREWIAQFTGENLRWDALGVLFNFWGMDSGERRGWAPMEREAAGLCVRISRDLAVRSSIWVRYLWFRKSIVESMYSGDASNSSWRYHGEMISAITFHGSHAEPPRAEPSPPTVASECERRLLWSAFIVDKLVVSFTGRPPLLSRRYVSTPLPLDINDDDLFNFEETLESVVARTIDAEGWNTQGGPYYSTLSRARAKLAVIADNIFEMVLSYDTTSYNIAMIRELKAKTDKVYEDFPRCIRWNGQDVKNPDVDQSTLMYRLSIRLDYLKNIFLLDRLLLRRGHCLDRSLVAVSYEMVAMTVLLWTDRERFIHVRADFEWMLMGYGVPAAGILCLEHLQPIISDTQQHQVEDGVYPRITRSEIVHILSILIGFLDWLAPSASNASICNKAKMSIQQALDHVLITASSGMQKGPSDEGLNPSTEFPIEWEHFDFHFDLMNTSDDWFNYDPAYGASIEP